MKESIKFCDIVCSHGQLPTSHYRKNFSRMLTVAVWMWAFIPSLSVNLKADFVWLFHCTIKHWCTVHWREFMIASDATYSKFMQVENCFFNIASMYILLWTSVHICTCSTHMISKQPIMCQQCNVYNHADSCPKLVQIKHHGEKIRVEIPLRMSEENC